ncbi:carbohydrate kinase [Niallia sp. JL1B1071]|uniref:carbohydrate kinase family protein n=1 Tax=Niallia tiangongensis TaxID=3237105 RepID=UPI0037DBFA95
MARKGILSLGDAFIDFVSRTSDNNSFDRNLGGASVNVAVHVSRFAIPSFYITKLGIEEDSKFVEGEMQKEQINLDDSVRTPIKKISKVFVHLDDFGERHFHNYENETPDEVVLETDIKGQSFENKSIFYFGSGTLFHPHARAATKKAISLAKERGVLIAFDANIRLKRWNSEEECRQVIRELLPFVDVLKLSEEELYFLMEVDTVEKGMEELANFHVLFQLVTLGEKGAIGRLFEQKEKVHVPAEAVKVLDTNGSGDAFMATILYYIHERGFPNTKEEMVNYMGRANKLGAMVATKKGSLPLLFNYQTLVL